MFAKSYRFFNENSLFERTTLIKRQTTFNHASVHMDGRILNCLFVPCFPFSFWKRLPVVIKAGVFLLEKTAGLPFGHPTLSWHILSQLRVQLIPSFCGCSPRFLSINEDTLR
jgi:hypothetical protein